jgi:hypothetical protein
VVEVALRPGLEHQQLVAVEVGLEGRIHSNTESHDGVGPGDFAPPQPLLQLVGVDPARSRGQHLSRIPQ